MNDSWYKILPLEYVSIANLRGTPPNRILIYQDGIQITVLNTCIIIACF